MGNETVKLSFSNKNNFTLCTFQICNILTNMMFATYKKRGRFEGLFLDPLYDTLLQLIIGNLIAFKTISVRPMRKYMQQYENHFEPSLNQRVTRESSEF